MGGRKNLTQLKAGLSIFFLYKQLFILNKYILGCSCRLSTTVQSCCRRLGAARKPETARVSVTVWACHLISVLENMSSGQPASGPLESIRWLTCVLALAAQLASSHC